MADQVLRGTTPTIRFQYSTVDVENITEAYQTIRQLGNVTIEKKLEDARTGEDYIEWDQSQTDTLSLRTGTCEVQCKFKLLDGTVGGSNIYTIEVLKALKDGQI